MWFKFAQRAGFTDIHVLNRQPMTVERLMRYPVYLEGLLDTLFAKVSPEARDHLVLSVLIRAVPGGVPAEDEGGTSCAL